MGYYWRTSVAASYPAEEFLTILDKIWLNEWVVETDLMDLTMHYNQKDQRIPIP